MYDAIVLHVHHVARLNNIVWEWNGESLQNSQTGLTNSWVHLIDLVKFVYLTGNIYMSSQRPVHININGREKYLPPKSNTY